MGTSKRLGEFEQLLLFALLHLEDEAHGTGIRRLILDRTGREVSPGALYTAMDRLEGQGMVSPSGSARSARKVPVFARSSTSTSIVPSTGRTLLASSPM